MPPSFVLSEYQEEGRTQESNQGGGGLRLCGIAGSEQDRYSFEVLWIIRGKYGLSLLDCL
jgi:hypothetical protein